MTIATTQSPVSRRDLLTNSIAVGAFLLCAALFVCWSIYTDSAFFVLPTVICLLGALVALKSRAAILHPAAIRLVQRGSLWFVEQRYAGGMFRSADASFWEGVGEDPRHKWEGTNEGIARKVYAEALRQEDLKRQRALPVTVVDITYTETLVDTDPGY